MTEPILADSIIPIGDANIPDITNIMDNLIHEVLPETTKSILEDEPITVPLKSPLFKRKHKTIHTHNDTEYNFDEKIKMCSKLLIFCFSPG